jgi:hypothetical protein
MSRSFPSYLVLARDPPGHRLQRVDVEPDNVSRLDKLRHQHFGALQFCSLEIAVRLRERGRRGIGIFQFEHVREDHAHQPAVEEFHR